MDFFLRLRNFLWPVHRAERSRFILTFGVLFLLLVIDCLIRSMHDTLLLTGTEHGAEALPFIDFWLVLPSAVLTTALYSKLRRFFSLNSLFICMLSAFLFFFVTFAFLLYPNLDALHSVSLSSWLQVKLSGRMDGVITTIVHWPITLFYVITALWKPLIIVILFWGSMNQTSSVEQAIRLYGPLMLSHSLAALTAGQLLIFVREHYATTEWLAAFQFVMATVVVLGIGAVLLFLRANHRLNEVGPSPTPSLLQSFSLLRKSPYLLAIALLILSDNISYILMQPLWKFYLRQLCPSPLDYMSYNGYINTFAAGLTALFAVGVTGPMIRRLGWTVTAMTTPIVLILTSTGFFFFILTQHVPVIERFCSERFDVSPIAAAVFCGAICECVCRSCKYTLLDSAKELAFVPLDRQTQVYAKATIDGVCGRLGKSTGSLLQQLVLIGSVTMASSTIPIALLILCFGMTAAQAAKAAGRGFYALTE